VLSRPGGGWKAEAERGAFRSVKSVKSAVRLSAKGREVAVGATKDALRAAVGYKYDRQSSWFV
jgi:hypothetical protein